MSIENHTVYPTNKHNRPRPPSKVALHGLDRIGAPIDIHNHRFYHCPSNTTSNVINVLKSTLAEALELYPPTTAVLQTDEDGNVYIVMDPDNIRGVPFIVETKDTPFTGDSENLSPRNIMILTPDLSILAVKITQFSCGTITVATSINHEITDLCGYLDFLKLWAKLAREKTIDFTEIPADWSRTPGRFFSDLNTSTTLSTPPPPFKVISTPMVGPPPYLTVPSEVTRWRFTKNAIERLKNDFSPSKSEPNVWISSGDALASLLCGIITRARENTNIARLEGRSSLESQVETVAMAADGRERSPHKRMSNGQYFGNFNTLWGTTISRSDLLSPTCESASRVALTIRQALNSQLSSEAVASKISFFENPQNNKPFGYITWSADIILTNWCRFDLQGPEYDFGWGKPFLATNGSGSVFPPGYCLMTQEKDTGVISVLMTIEREGLDVLKNDSLLNKYATLIPDLSSR
ncbi:MAG: transferase [Benjaminiella poitrasii]|nr:MAG: transferase [Benjaminiella poitrasii]